MGRVSTQRKKLIEDARAAGFKVTFLGYPVAIITICKINLFARRYTCGIRLYPDGTAVDLTVPFAYQKAIRTYKGMRSVLGL